MRVVMGAGSSGRGMFFRLKKIQYPGGLAFPVSFHPLSSMLVERHLPSERSTANTQMTRTDGFYLHLRGRSKSNFSGSPFPSPIKKQ
jgi:hypothetical protein